MTLTLFDFPYRVLILNDRRPTRRLVRCPKRITLGCVKAPFLFFFHRVRPCRGLTVRLGLNPGVIPRFARHGAGEEDEEGED